MWIKFLRDASPYKTGQAADVADYCAEREISAGAAEKCDEPKSGPASALSPRRGVFVPNRGEEAEPDAPEGEPSAVARHRAAQKRKR